MSPPSEGVAMNTQRTTSPRVLRARLTALAVATVLAGSVWAPRALASVPAGGSGQRHAARALSVQQLRRERDADHLQHLRAGGVLAAAAALSYRRLAAEAAADLAQHRKTEAAWRAAG